MEKTEEEQERQGPEEGYWAEDMGVKGIRAR